MNTPTFNILERGEKVKTLIHCFIKRIMLPTANLPMEIKSENGETYQCIYDSFVVPAHNPAWILAIISFQKHTYGNYAIIRNIQEKL